MRQAGLARMWRRVPKDRNGQSQVEGPNESSLAKGSCRSVKGDAHS